LEQLLTAALGHYIIARHKSLSTYFFSDYATHSITAVFTFQTQTREELLGTGIEC
jgi:hypothetical protein